MGVHLDRRGTADRVEAVVGDVRSHGVEALFINANAADERRRAEVLDALQQAHPDARIGVYMHSLAFGSLRPFIGEPRERTAPRDMAMTLEVMAHSFVWWAQDLVDRDLFAPGARIFAMTSSGSLVALPSYGPVSAAKASLESHVRQLAVELAPRGITVNAIMAGLTHTPALEAIPGWEALAEYALEHNPCGRLTTPEDVANCLLALAVPGTSWMTGNVLRVDGGETIVR